jgi:hypothetical protein
MRWCENAESACYATQIIREAIGPLRVRRLWSSQVVTACGWCCAHTTVLLVVMHDHQKECMGVQGLMAQLNQGTEAEEVGGNAWRELCGVRRVQWEKFLKTKMEDAIRLFNEDYRKGFQMMQARPRPSALLCPRRLVTLCKTCPRA